MAFRFSGRATLAFCALLLLSGCGGFDDAMTYVGLGDDGPPEQVGAYPGDPTPVADAAPTPPPAPDAWCAQIAANDRRHAVQDGFDQATQQRMTAESYKQCTAMAAIH